ncbi:DUF2225 domain-containing protein [Flavobacterium sp. LC2016-01]|uniref:DUF2225 domain-containing protein n=1 Tax=Flavobacterium sp. LC2016-01 TaxID=2675876 RepID=UPI0012BAF1F4|nr:DUF2225 domain-containing protein [Flavobacterium sp. LC2016-01]MTH14508.1 DUF2225 domain-containing protein [Flavobacterium sp. LC2016-01]
MKKIYFAFLFLFTINLANAHTCENETVNCPLDNAKVDFCVTMSMTTFGSLKDFQKQGAIGSFYEELINSCPKCHFSGYIDDFKAKYSDEEKAKIKTFLQQYEQTKMTDIMQCKVAGDLKEFLSAPNAKIAHCYLVGSYLARDKGKFIDLRKELQVKTKTFLVLALEKNEYEDKTSIANIDYLIAEMCRRTANFDDAIKYYDLALNDPNKQEWIDEVAKMQKDLALKKDDNNTL